jgi:hypothetical protein
MAAAAILSNSETVVDFGKGRDPLSGLGCLQAQAHDAIAELAYRQQGDELRCALSVDVVYLVV